jgi:hypothetical protein
VVAPTAVEVAADPTAAVVVVGDPTAAAVVAALTVVAITNSLLL